MKNKNDETEWRRGTGHLVVGQSLGYPTMTRYGWAVAAAMRLSPGAVVHHPVHEVQVVASKFMFEPAGSVRGRAQ